MMTYRRILRIELPARQSAFLWGPRKSGKTSYLRARFPDSLTFDLLDTDLVLELHKRPARFREQVLAAPVKTLRTPVIVDEVQKVPTLLDEVHGLIERGLRFILSGSSARKVKRGRANLLGGRAWRFEMHPLVFPEIPDFDLLRALERGLLPPHYASDGYRRSLKAYVRDYLKEEVFDEGLTRNVPAFSRFFDAMAFSHGELTNYSNIARDCGVDAKTVKEYYRILEDTLLGTTLEPFAKRRGRDVILKAGKFFLFDVGVAGFLVKRQVSTDRGEAFGRAFEHFVLMELLAHRSYRELDHDIRFWRTKTGLEVDYVLGSGEVAIEVKGGRRIDGADFRPLEAFVEEHHPRLALLVCNETRPRMHGNIRVLPWRAFLEQLWDGQIIH
jgi:predicted AAA+ superfamily ATPase